MSKNIKAYSRKNTISESVNYIKKCIKSTISVKAIFDEYMDDLKENILKNIQIFEEDKVNTLEKFKIMSEIVKKFLDCIIGN